MSNVDRFFISVFFIINTFIFFYGGSQISLDIENLQKSITPIHDTIYLDNTVKKIDFNKKPLTKENVILAIKQYGIKYPNIVYAQAVLETGHFKSNICLEKNNLFGLYNSNKMEFYNYGHWSESIQGYIDLVEYKYDKMKPPDYYTFLQQIGYAEDPNYINKVKKIVNQMDCGEY